jgi:hypothetical protein
MTGFLLAYGPKLKLGFGPRMDGIGFGIIGYFS